MTFEKGWRLPPWRRQLRADMQHVGVYGGAHRLQPAILDDIEVVDLRSAAQTAVCRPHFSRASG